MIIVRSPLRISLGGGGTDLPSFYNNHGGFVISAAINKYVFTTITKPFEEGYYLKYSSTEKVKDIKKIKHPIIREVLIEENLKNLPLEITTLADIPSGTGLGSSGSFTSSLIKALYVYKDSKIDKETLAKKSCKIEIDRLRDPVGKQDQYIATYGGLRSFNFYKNEKVLVKNLRMKKDSIKKLEKNLLMFFTGQTRASKKILITQKNETELNNKKMIDNLMKIKEMGYEVKKILENGNLDQFGEIMNRHWFEKKKRSKQMTNFFIEKLYNDALKNGAIGGKLVGAGGGGFLLFYCHDTLRLKNFFKKKKIEEIDFKFEFNGTQTIMS